LYVRIILELKLKEKHGMAPSITNLVEDDMAMASKLFMHVVNIRKQICDVLDGFLSFVMKYEEKKTHNMLFLMLHLIF
jgi:hypothetical protein